jgi:hypothetical protein
VLNQFSTDFWQRIEKAPKNSGGPFGLHAILTHQQFKPAFAEA